MFFFCQLKLSFDPFAASTACTEEIRPSLVAALNRLVKFVETGRCGAMLRRRRVSVPDKLATEGKEACWGGRCHEGECLSVSSVTIMSCCTRSRSCRTVSPNVSLRARKHRIQLPLPLLRSRCPARLGSSRLPEEAPPRRFFLGATHPTLCPMGFRAAVASFSTRARHQPHRAHVQRQEKWS